MGFFKKLFGGGQSASESELIIKKDRTEKELRITLIGRMNAMTAPQLGEVVKNELSDIIRLVLDLTELEYMSSAGLRVIMDAFDVMKRQGSMTLLNPAEAVMDVQDETGLAGFMEIIHDR